MQINVQQAATQSSVIQAGHLVNNEAIQMLGKKRRKKKKPQSITSHITATTSTI